MVIERISGERAVEVLPPMFKYNTQMTVTKINEDHAAGVGIYEFKVNLNSDPIAVSISLGGKARVQAQNSEEKAELFEKRSKRRE